MLPSLLLDQNYMAISILSWKKALRLIAKDKVERVGETVANKIRYGLGKVIEIPSIIRLKYNIKYNCFSANTKFTKRNLMVRDALICQYCGSKLSKSSCTIDHIIPRSRGGKTSFTNCVMCCADCNTKKRDNTPDEVGMRLLAQPKTPNLLIFFKDYNEIPDEWGIFITWNK